MDKNQEEWKLFWQRLALGCLSICGVLLTGMVRRFVSDFDRVASTVQVMSFDVKRAIEGQAVLERQQEAMLTRIKRLEEGKVGVGH